MKHAAIFTALAMLALTACDKKTEQEPFVPTPRSASSSFLPAGHPPVNSGDQPMPPSDTPKAVQTQKATVVSVIDIPQFSYIEVKQNQQKRWLAASTIAAKKGDVIEFDDGATLENFNSKVLNRTFDSITFVNNASIAKGK